IHIAAISYIRRQEGTPIESLPEKVNHLEMSNCSMVELSIISLTECDISKNKFKMLSLNETLKKVESLNLSGNLITQIDPTSPIILLTSLDISQNLVSEISDRLGKFLPILKYFNLSRNKISFLQSRLLPESLIKLDISNNAITTIVEDILGRLTKFNVLTVQGKHFFCNCDLHWFVNTYIHRPNLRKSKMQLSTR
uniref:Uncharacterized protein n=1 Tax=Terrapene triunguis TaxID=2587831 RepID=A0A674IKR7_9SAUR